MKVQAMSFEENNYYLQRRRCEERLRQVKITFRVAIFLIIPSTLSIITGLIFFIVKNPSGGVTTVVGIISTAFSGLIFTFYHYENKKLDQTAQELRDLAIHLDETQGTQQLINQINDINSRDSTIIDLIMSRQTTHVSHQTTQQIQNGPSPISRIFSYIFHGHF